jgi:predicted transposase YbfD/YdcC
MAQGFGKLVLNRRQQREAKILRKSVLQNFQHLEDPRVGRRRDHNLIAIISIAILAVLAGADGFVAIETYGKAKQEWLETFLDLPYGIPSHDTFGRVFGLLDPHQLQKGFQSWVESITEKLGLELIHIDGKTLRGSYDREEKLKALHSVSAWSSEHNLVLGQQKVESKTNEIKAIPLLLKLLNLKGAVVTVDAMGTQIEIVKQIKNDGGEYVCGLKGNQGLLYQQVSEWFKESEAKHWEGIDYSYDETVEAGHHRIETRRVWTVPVQELPKLHRQAQWVGLATVVMVYTKRQLWNKTTEEVRFYLSSLESNAKNHNRVIRSHWSIENSLHWVLDVTFSEDASRVRQGHAAENLALVRRLSVSLLKGEPSRQSLKQKRYLAGLDNNFLVKILEANIAA